MTVILNQEQIKKAISLDESLIPIIENAFVSLSEGKATTPPIMRLDIPEFHGEADVKTAYIKGLDSFAIKIALGFFNNPSIGLPTSNGLMILFNSETGSLKAVLLDQGYLTDIRTAIAGAIASKHLANVEINNVGIIGSGMQAQLQLQALMLVRKPTTAYIWGRDQAKTATYIDTMKKKLKINFHQCLNIDKVCRKSEIVITATPSTEPLIKEEWLKKGMHITAMGSDAEHKNELDSKIIKSCSLYVPDKQSQTNVLGELHHAIKKRIVDINQRFTELGEIINNPELGRKTKDDITVCDLTGTGVQDTAIARHTFNLANTNI